MHADRIAKALERERVDAAIGIANSPLSAYLARRLPVIHLSDATVPIMRDYYIRNSHACQSSWREAAFELDRDTVKYSRACLYPTEWAASSALSDYKADRSRVHVIPWGCNLEKNDIPSDTPYVRSDQCNLVFIGVDWTRKGGDIVIDAFERLLDLGCPALLDIIGAKPNLQKRRRGICHITEHGFISKGTPDGLSLYQSIMRKASFLFVPTRQDCYGIVFAEASAYGVPVISTRTGGVPGAVEDGVNGYLLGTDAGADKYAELIQRLWLDDELYRRLRKSSRARFEQILNWDSWLARAAPVIDAALSSAA